MRAPSLALFVFGFGAAFPSAPPAEERPHPIVLRRERLNRQASHARGRKGHR